MKKKILILLLGALALVGCEDSVPVTKYSSGTKIHGRTLKCLEVKQAMNVHYVYYFDDEGEQPVSIDYQVQEEKTSRTETIVIDGSTYKKVD